MTRHSSPTGAPHRFRLPPDRQSLTHEFTIGEFTGYLTIGFYQDGRIGEVFLEAEKQGSTLSGTLGAFGRSLSIGLQHGIPLDHYVQSFKHMRFTPEGITNNADIRITSSIMDYMFKYLEMKLENGYYEDMRPKPQPATAVAELTQEGPPERRQDPSSIRDDDSPDPAYRATEATAPPANGGLQIRCKSNT